MPELIERLNNVLEGFKIPARCCHAWQHRHFVFYDLEIQTGCRLTRLQNCLTEIALALRSHTKPILKIIPQSGLVRLQMTHGVPGKLNLVEMYAKSHKPPGFLPFLLGETDEGNPLWIDMSTNPHLLVAGTTGSGKSVFLHNLIYNALNSFQTKLYLVDTKLVEFGQYQHFPQVTELAQSYEEALQMLNRLESLMESRYQMMRHYNFTGIEQCPWIFDKILVIIDEAADLMLMDRSGEFEKILIKLAAKSRAAGIYFVMATQRPSAEVVTGLIKANFPARLACKTASRTDSQVIMDTPGAENLGGKGEALFKNHQFDNLRLQIAFSDITTNLTLR